jgi:hypothetical protein
MLDALSVRGVCYSRSFGTLSGRVNAIDLAPLSSSRLKAAVHCRFGGLTVAADNGILITGMGCALARGTETMQSFGLGRRMDFRWALRRRDQTATTNLLSSAGTGCLTIWRLGMLPWCTITHQLLDAFRSELQRSINSTNHCAQTN